MKAYALSCYSCCGRKVMLVFSNARGVYSCGHSVVVTTASCQAILRKCQVFVSTLALWTLALVPRQMLVMTGQCSDRLVVRAVRELEE